jgi:hypothetical protein
VVSWVIPQRRSLVSINGLESNIGPVTVYFLQMEPLNLSEQRWQDEVQQTALNPGFQDSVHKVEYPSSIRAELQ